MDRHLLQAGQFAGLHILILRGVYVVCRREGVFGVVEEGCLREWEIAGKYWSIYVFSGRQAAMKTARRAGHPPCIVE